MKDILVDFKYIGVFSSIALAIGLIVLILAFVSNKRRRYNDKLTGYECGFNPFEDSLNRVDTSFYLVGILLLVFDLELVFLFPWAMSSSSTKLEGLVGMLIFFAVIMLGFVYEIRAGALTWKKES